MKNKAIVFIVVVCTLFFCGCEASEEKVMQDDVGGCVSNYVDPETGVNYLIFRDFYKGGITVRYNADGTIMVTDKESAE